MTDRELMQQALDALCDIIPANENRSEINRIQHSAITALRSRLAQPKQKPIAWTDENFSDLYVSEDIAADMGATVELYTSPPQRKPEQEPIKESSVTHSHLWIGELWRKEKNT